MSDLISPFRFELDEAELEAARDRVAATRWPQPETVGDSSQGPQLAKLQRLTEHWSSSYDWRRCERALAALGQHQTTIDGLDIHFLHVRSAVAGALPLLITHGWPSSVLDFQEVVGPLTDPAAHGGDPADAFDVVIPSLPGFGFTGKPAGPGWSIERVAAAWIELMRRLGYERWAAQGGDLGAAVTDAIAHRAPAGCLGIHLNFALIMPTPDEVGAADAEEQVMLHDAKHFMDAHAAYAQLQTTRPQTIGYALADSPVGQAAWIYDLLESSCATPWDAEASFSLDELLDTIMMYWLPNAGASSARTYWEMGRSGWQWSATPQDVVALPTAFSRFPQERVRQSKRWLESRYSDLFYFHEAARGGHYAALEAPDEFVGELRAAFRALR